MLSIPSLSEKAKSPPRLRDFASVIFHAVQHFEDFDPGCALMNL